MGLAPAPRDWLFYRGRTQPGVVLLSIDISLGVSTAGLVVI